MSATILNESELHALERVVSVGDDAPSMEERCSMTEILRGRSRERARVVDRFLIERAVAFTEARLHQERLREIIGGLTEPPWFSAVFLRLLGDDEPRAVILQAGTQRVVRIAEGVEPESLAPGDEVFLGHELNVVVGRSADGVPRFGETAVFERRTSDGRIVLQHRDEELVVGAAHPLAETHLERGDRLRWDRTAWMAFERLERTEGQHFLLEEVPDIAPGQVGGQGRSFAALMSTLTTTLLAPEKATLYGLGNRHAILLHGPPGCGKTLMVRAAASQVSRLAGQRCRIAVVKPAEWQSPWVGETEQNIRNCFRALREATRDGFAILFLDEIEAVGRIRGSAVGHHSDRFLAALLTELDGFVDRSGIAVIAATNRKDLIDPALLGRVADLEVAVARPDMRAAREIFAIHLPEWLPYRPNGAAAPDTRQQLIDAAVSGIYAPNADNELYRLRFRDGKTRSVAARELASGRMIQQISLAARRSALQRDAGGGEPGVGRADIDAALGEALDRLASTLSVHNVAAYLSDLPQDIDVVAVEPIVRRVPQPHRFLNPN